MNTKHDIIRSQSPILSVELRTGLKSTVVTEIRNEQPTNLVTLDLKNKKVLRNTERIPWNDLHCHMKSSREHFLYFMDSGEW
jgi:hypothetical protein